MNPASTVTRAFATPSRTSWAAEVVVARHARGLDLADEVAVGVDEAGQDGEAAEVDDARIVGGALASGRDRLDPRVADQQGPVGEQVARRDIEQSARADRDPAVASPKGGVGMSPC